MKLALLVVSLVSLVGCASQPAPMACYTSFYESAGPYASKAQQEAAQIRETQRQQFLKENCYGRMGGSVTVSDSDVAPLRFRYVGPFYRGGPSYLEPY